MLYRIHQPNKDGNVGHQLGYISICANNAGADSIDAALRKTKLIPVNPYDCFTPRELYLVFGNPTKYGLNTYILMRRPHTKLIFLHPVYVEPKKEAKAYNPWYLPGTGATMTWTFDPTHYPAAVQVPVFDEQAQIAQQEINAARGAEGPIYQNDAERVGPRDAYLDRLRDMIINRNNY